MLQLIYQTNRRVYQLKRNKKGKRKKEKEKEEPWKVQLASYLVGILMTGPNILNLRLSTPCIFIVVLLSLKGYAI